MQKVYPTWRYHAEEEPRLVHSVDEDNALGAGWHDTPRKEKSELAREATSARLGTAARKAEDERLVEEDAKAIEAEMAALEAGVHARFTSRLVELRARVTAAEAKTNEAEVNEARVVGEVDEERARIRKEIAAAIDEMRRRPAEAAVRATSKAAVAGAKAEVAEAEAEVAAETQEEAEPAKRPPAKKRPK